MRGKSIIFDAPKNCLFSIRGKSIAEKSFLNTLSKVDMLARFMIEIGYKFTNDKQKTRESPYNFYKVVQPDFKF
ncbi:hypothetical protein BpHYR1_002370 [Brachionus plicatilis]|uniref:Uncharacterized protein n=1 Tax=Brachionus plicatilis TaxID=10195 RepID=A0A3M7Q8R8_BRAPC|nr:hypothetical protein BpHYR1_002370 [Brachionus plicatilis]